MIDGATKSSARLILRLLAVFAGAMILIAPAVPAFAHAERSSSDPEPDSRLRDVPTEVVIEFTEPPTADASIHVLDGCENDVANEILLSGTTVTARLDEGRPGSWTVESRVVSAVDGHPTRDSFEFRVRGAPDCEDVAAPAPDVDEEGPDEGDGDTLPLIPIGLGVAALLLVTIAVRVASSR